MHAISGISIKGESYLPIPLSSLRVDTVTGFDLFLYPKPDHKPTLYREKQVPFTADTRARLLESSTEVLLVHASQEREFRDYLEGNIASILNDDELTAHEKSEIVYTSAQWLVRDALSDPRSKDVAPRSAAMADHLTEFILADETTVDQLLKVTSYDYYTYTHSVNVTVFSLALAERLGFDADTLRRLGQGALLHDLGKSQLDLSIINSKGKLSDAQWDAMRRHPVIGYDLLVEQGITDEIVLSVTRSHHEKLTGGGYPDGLKADEISPIVRVSTICDIFDALTTRRSYKSALDSFPALKLMNDEMRTELDPAFFKVFVTMMGNK